MRPTEGWQRCNWGEEGGPELFMWSCTPERKNCSPNPTSAANGTYPICNKAVAKLTPGTNPPNFQHQ